VVFAGGGNGGSGGNGALSLRGFHQTRQRHLLFLKRVVGK